MSPLIRRLGVAAVAAILLLVSAGKLWATASGVAAAGALFGAGLVVLGIAVRDWIRPGGGDEDGLRVEVVTMTEVEDE